MTKFRQISHVIFDMDGVLLGEGYLNILNNFEDNYLDNLPLAINRNLFYQHDGAPPHGDTEPLYTKAIQNLVGKYGKTFTWDIKGPMMGLHHVEGAKYIVKALDLPLTWKEYDEAIQEEYNIVLANPDIIPGAKKLVQHLAKHNIPIAVATSSSTDSFELKSANHKDFFKLFDHIVCGGSDPDVLHGKPSPDIFLVAANRFSPKPKSENCLVVEDAPNGVKAALSAGMQVVMVPDENLAEDQRQGATLVVSSLELTPLDKFGLPSLKET